MHALFSAYCSYSVSPLSTRTVREHMHDCVAALYPRLLIGFLHKLVEALHSSHRWSLMCAGLSANLGRMSATDTHVFH